MHSYVTENIEQMSALDIYAGLYAKMAGAIYSFDVLQIFYSPIPEEENRNLPKALQPDVVICSDMFTLAQSKKKE